MPLSDERIAELELPINRTTYQLGRGVSEENITPSLIGHDVQSDEISEIIRISRKRTTTANAVYRKMTRKSALIYIAGGAGLLTLMWIATSGGSEMPHGRFAGRAVISFILGAGAFLYGAWRWIDPSYRDR